MSNNNLFRYSGFAAIASAVLYVVSLVMTIATGGAPSAVGFVLIIVSSLLFLLVIGALYRVHRSEAAGMSLTALILAAVGTIGGLFLDPSKITPLFGLVALLFAIGMLLFGWLAYRSPKMPRGMGIVVIVTGALGLVLTAAAFAGSSGDVVGLINLILIVPYVVWLIWLGRHWLANPTSPQG